MQKRPSKEFKILKDLDFGVKYGTFNKDTPKTIYITGKTWVKPKSENFVSGINNIINLQKSYKVNSKLFSNKSIVNVEVARDRMKLGKETLLSFEIHLLQKQLRSLKDFELINDINQITTEFIDKVKGCGSKDLDFSNEKVLVSEPPPPNL